MTSLVHVTRHVASRGTCLRSSYLAISQFFRTRHHGTTPGRAQHALRCFSQSSIGRERTTPNEKLRRTLDDYKATSMSLARPPSYSLDPSAVRPSPWSSIATQWEHLGRQPDSLDKHVLVYGYMSTRRDVNKKLSFTMLRNQQQTYCIQLVSSANSEGPEADAHTRLRSSREWTPVLVRGVIRAREEAKKGKHLNIKLIVDREIAVEHVEPLNELSDETIIKDDTVFGPDQRHLQLRTDAELRENLRLRAKAISLVRGSLSGTGWTEIETPILFKSTPEGAREFLVPTRQKGLAYALPQSPQQYKQILMASGFNKYYQFARCFRDEDLRADRQPEFTQLDMEMSFAGEEDVMAEAERVLRRVWYRLKKISVPEAFPRMTYREAMASYGSDKPDLRYNAKVCRIIIRLSRLH
jgi:aspartyl-tRNA synthetase